MQPGVSVAQLARENNINDNLLFNWRRLYQQGLLAARTDAPVMLPVTLAAESGPGQPHPPSVQSDDAPCCELVLPRRHASYQRKADARAASDAYPGNAGEFAVISLPAGSRIWLVAGITDMRNGFNGLASRGAEYVTG